MQHLRAAFLTHCQLRSPQPSIFSALVPPPAGYLLRVCYPKPWTLVPAPNHSEGRKEKTPIPLTREVFILFLFLLHKGRVRENERASDKSSCYCHFLLVKLSSTQLNTEVFDHSRACYSQVITGLTVLLGSLINTPSMLACLSH